MREKLGGLFAHTEPHAKKNVMQANTLQIIDIFIDETPVDTRLCVRNIKSEERVTVLLQDVLENLDALKEYDGYSGCILGYFAKEIMQEERI